MKLERICLYNWRSFYGENNILISVNEDKNVTLIRAENGVGKTSFLAALNWCFYGILPNISEFEDPESLVNKHAIEKNGADHTWVEVDFEHQGKRYRAKRQYTQSTKQTDGIGIEQMGEGGDVPVSTGFNKDHFISSVLPKEMAPHFFFYGESTGRFTGSSGSQQFGRAVKGILGSTIARATLKDLEKVMADYNREAADTTSEEARQVEADISGYSNKIDQTHDEIVTFEEESLRSKEERQKLDQQLSGLEQTKTDQAARSKLETQLGQVSSNFNNAMKDSKKWLQKFGSAILAEELIAEATSVANQEDTRGKIPAPYNEQFVTKVLTDEKCICGADLSVGSEAHELIKDMLKTAGDQVAEARVIHVKTLLGSLGGAANGAWDAKEAQDKRIADLETRHRSLSARIEVISKRLKDNPAKDIQDLEKAREKHDQNVTRAHKSIGERQARIKQFERMKASKESDLQKLLRESVNARRYVKRAQLAAALTARLSSKLSAKEAAARDAIASEIDNIVEGTLRKKVDIVLDNNYQIKMFQDGVLHAKSTGENQLLGLAFTSAIAKYAKDRVDSTEDFLLPGTVAPLVVDSPFGQLDGRYKSSVARFVPRLASQVVLLLNTEQASEAVMNEIADKIGNQYVLTRHNLGDQDDKMAETLEINGKHYDLTKYNAKIDGTRIQEVRPAT